MPTPLETALENLATETWQRLRDIKAFLVRPEPFNMVRLGETNITDLAMMDLCRRGLSRSIFIQTPPDKERFHGTDFEWWIGSDALGWFRLAVQAKKLDMKRGRYLAFGHKVGGKPQIQVLEEYADEKKATPLYCLYNYSNIADPEKHWHCCQRPFRPEELGCSITPASRVSDAIHTRGKRSFEFIHECDQTLPWQCLASCPYVHNALVQRGMKATVSPFFLFDPRSYHPELPPFLGGQRGNLPHIRMGLPVDEDGPPGVDVEGDVPGLVGFEDEVEGYVPELVDFDDEVAEHYRPLREQPDIIPLPGAVYVTPLIG